MENHAYRTKVVVELDMTLNESEIGALNAIACYGTKAFLETFYRDMGRSYLEPYEGGLRSLFDKIRNSAPAPMKKVKDARKCLSDSKIM